MDIEDIQSDLQALRKLYGLLKSDGCSLQNEKSENLDHKARLLLRNLLDAAAERLFRAHAEILAARHGSNDTACSTKQEQSKEMLKLQLQLQLQSPPFLTTNVSNNFASVVQSTSKDLNTRKAVLEKNEWESSKPASQMAPSEQSGLKIFSSQPQVRKRCRVCQRSKAKQLKSSDEPKAPNFGIPNQPHDLPFQFGQADLLERELKKAPQTDSFIESQRLTGSSEFQSNRTEIGYSAFLSCKPAAGIVGSGGMQGLVADVLKKPEVADQISKEASFKIQEIELRIFDLQVASKSENPLQIQHEDQYKLHEPMSSSDPGTESASSMLQTKRQLVTRNNLSQVDFFAGRNDLKSRPTSQKVWEPTQWHQVPYQFTGTKMSNQTIARTLEPFPPFGALPIQTSSQNVKRIKGITFEYDRLNEVGKPSEEYKMPRQEEKKVPGKNARIIIDRIESVSEVRSRDDHMESQNSKFGQHQTGVEKSTGFENVGKSQPSTPSVRPKFSRLQAVDAGSELSRARTKGETRMPDQKITRKNLLNHKPPQHRVAPRLYDDQWEKDQGGVRKKNYQFGPRRLISPSEEVSESTGSRSVYSSSWTSQQVSTSFSDVEEYSASSQTRSHYFSGSSTSNVGPNVSRSRSESEIYSVSSRSRDYPLDSDSSGESQDDYLSSDGTPVHHQSLGSTSSRLSMDPANSRRLEKKQQPGRLKKLKDKLAIIFHHHHHHHHHHHGHDDDDNDSGPHVVVKGGKALWKHAGKILDRSKEEGYGEKAVKKVRKSAGHNVPDKNQRGHFHALVDGLLQHVRHSKKSKPPKGGGGRTGSGGKKVAAKLHWWQMLSRQRGSKMAKKPHGKARVGRRNPRLKALPEP